MAVIGNPESGHVLLPEVGAVVTLPSGGKAPGAKPTPAYEEPAIGDDKIAYWGTANDFPQQIIKKASEDTHIPAIIDWKVRALYGRGVMPYTVEGYNDDGSEVLKPLHNHAEINEFMRRANVNRYIKEATTDLYWFLNVFPELILSKDRGKIIAIAHQEAAYCRWSVQNEQTGLSEHCYISGMWPNASEKQITKVPVVNARDPYRVELLKMRREHKYIYPLTYPSPGRSYYALAHWDGARTSGWMEIAREIPKWKKAMMTNQISLKYHVRISEDWWKWKFPEWDTWAPNKKRETMLAELTKFNDFLTGAEAAGLSLMTTYKTDIVNGKEYGGWKIEPVESKLNDKAYIEDSQEASLHLLRALGVDPTLVGFGPGNKQGAGSGSDKRVALNIYQELLYAHRDTVVEPLDFIGQYNGWPENLVWRFPHSLVTTLDKGKEVESES